MSDADTGSAENGDPMFNDPYVDLDEWRDVPVRHRYVHGGFTGTRTRFSIYLPPEPSYEGRFFQHITPVPDSEHLAQHQPPGEQDKIGFALDSGAYFLETNGGGVHGGYGSEGPDRGRISGQCRQRAVLPGWWRPRCTGTTGRTATPTAGVEAVSAPSAASRTRWGVWDGVVPYVIGSPMAIPNMFTVRMHAQRILRHQPRADSGRRRAGWDR